MLTVEIVKRPSKCSCDHPSGVETICNMAATGELVLTVAATEVHQPLKKPISTGAHQVGLQGHVQRHRHQQGFYRGRIASARLKPSFPLPYLHCFCVKGVYARIASSVIATVTCRTPTENYDFAERGRAQAPLLPPAHLPNGVWNQGPSSAQPRLLQTELPKCTSIMEMLPVGSILLSVIKPQVQ